MNQLYRLTVFGPTAALLMMVTALGQTTTPQPVSTSTAAENAEREKTALYNSFAETYKTDAARAYATACEYLQRFASDESGQTRSLKKFVRRFERSMRQLHVERLFNEKGYNEANFAEAFRFGKEMLKSDPNDFVTLYMLVQGGAIASTNGNKSYQADAAEYAKKALTLIDNEPGLADKESNLALLYVSLGVFYFTSDEEASRYYFSKFSELRRALDDPTVYAQIADGIIRAEFEPLQTEFDSRYRTDELQASPGAKVMRLRLYFIADFIIDTLARGIALAGTDKRFAHLTPYWMETLISFYRYRNGDYVTGLSDLIQKILLEPFPRPRQHYF